MAGILTVSTLSDGSNSTPLSSLMSSKVLAWISFSPTSSNAIKGAFNVSSITDNGTGNFTLNFTTALPHPNYVVCGCSEDTDSQGDAFVGRRNAAIKTVSQAQVTTITASATFADFPLTDVAIIG